MYYFIKMLKKNCVLIKYFGDLLFYVLNDFVYMLKKFFFVVCLFLLK